MLTTLERQTRSDAAAHSQGGAASSGTAAVQERLLWIQPGLGALSDDLREVYEYRELFVTLVWRDLTTRYRHTLMGVGWALVQPVTMMLVLALFYGRFMHTPTNGCPYPVFAFSALICFQYFATAVTRASGCIMGTGTNALLKKVYFPRAILPIASVTVPLVDFGIAFLLLLVMMGFYHIAPTPKLLLLPCFAAMVYAAAIGVSLWTSALYVKFRDIYHLVPFVMQALMFASPIAYSSSIVPAPLQPFYNLNILVAIIDGFRWCLLGHGVLNVQALCTCIAAITLLTISGAFYFRAMEGTFSDYI